jgi:Family of unknown function (DUF5317)
VGGVVLVALVVLAGIGAGVLQRGSFDGLTRTRARLGALLAAAVVVQLLLAVARLAGLGAWVVVGLSVIALAGLLIFALANLRLPGMTLVAIGLGCDLLVTVLNGGAPVTAGALARAGRAATPAAGQVLVDAGTRLPQLADALAVRWLGAVVSVGDIALYAGLFLLVQGLMVERADGRQRFQEFDYGVRGTR